MNRLMPHNNPLRPYGIWREAETVWPEFRGFPSMPLNAAPRRITATDLVRRGWVVRQAVDDEKHPGYGDAGSPGLSLSEVEALRPARVNVVLGSTTHPNRSGVIDVETDGPEAEVLLRELCGGIIPPGPMMTTPSGSVHRLFIWPEVPEGYRLRLGKDLLRWKREKGVSCKIDVMWQFLALDGTKRTWTDFDLAVPALPTGLRDALVVPVPARPEYEPRAEGEGDDERERAYALGALTRQCDWLTELGEGDDRPDGAHLTGLKMGGYIEAGSLDEDEVVTAALIACDRNGSVERYTADDMERQIKNGIENGRAGGPKYAPPVVLPTFEDPRKAGGKKIYGRRATEVTELAVDWLWQNRIARGFLNLLGGDVGDGKTALLNRLEAYVTTGHPFPGETEWRKPGSVIHISFEETAEHIIKPRLRVMGADLSRTQILDVGEDEFIDAENIMDLGPTIEDLGDVQLVVIDPMDSFITGGVNTGIANQVRAALKQTTVMAKQYNVAVVIIVHANKNTLTEAVHRIAGTLGGFVGYSRVTLATGWYQGERMLTVLKNNLGPNEGLTWQYALRSTPGEEGIVSADFVTERPEVDKEMLSTKAGDAAKEGDGGSGAPGSKLDAAKEWLRERLADGPRAAEELEDEALDDGLSWATIRRASSDMPIKKRRGGRDDRRYFWTLHAGAAAERLYRQGKKGPAAKAHSRSGCSKVLGPWGFEQPGYGMRPGCSNGRGEK